MKKTSKIAVAIVMLVVFMAFMFMYNQKLEKEKEKALDLLIQEEKNVIKLFLSMQHNEEVIDVYSAAYGDIVLSDRSKIYLLKTNDENYRYETIINGYELFDDKIVDSKMDTANSSNFIVMTESNGEFYFSVARNKKNDELVDGGWSYLDEPYSNYYFGYRNFTKKAPINEQVDQVIVNYDYRDPEDNQRYFYVVAKSDSSVNIQR